MHRAYLHTMAMCSRILWECIELRCCCFCWARWNSSLFRIRYMHVYVFVACVCVCMQAYFSIFTQPLFCIWFFVPCHSVVYTIFLTKYWSCTRLFVLSALSFIRMIFSLCMCVCVFTHTHTQMHTFAYLKNVSVFVRCIFDHGTLHILTSPNYYPLNSKYNVSSSVCCKIAINFNNLFFRFSSLLFDFLALVFFRSK